MPNESLQIKDNSRNGLLKYTEKTFSLVQETDQLNILEIRCGPGVNNLFKYRFNPKINKI